MAIEDYRAERKEEVIFKIGFEKTYDHVDLDFLDRMMEKKISGINGGCGLCEEYELFDPHQWKPKGLIKASRGLR